MQPAAATPGLCTPGHSVLSASAGTVEVPSSASCAFTEEVRNPAGGRTRSLADAVPARESAKAHTHASARIGVKRIRFLPKRERSVGDGARRARADRLAGLLGL